MPETNVKFLKILKAELEEILEDIDHIEKRAAERFAKMEISEYVYRENDGILILESKAIRELISAIDEIDAAGYKSLDDLVEHLDGLARVFVREHEDPEAVYRFFHRKLVKVRRYIDAVE